LFPWLGSVTSLYAARLIFIVLPLLLDQNNKNTFTPKKKRKITQTISIGTGSLTNDGHQNPKQEREKITALFP
jgi:hypothetical protein